MSAFTLLPAAQHRRMLWRNCLGSTLEIARDTPAAAEDWNWRVSLADVAQSGAFSPFPGMTRIISVIEGAGMVLNIEGAPDPEAWLLGSIRFLRRRSG
ncbi:HutD/Ves family protein [Pseudomonas sp. KNUC1026]|uniref:HutD/Ves family protein n=1 Tax=Pseudomonas sp. KNUC1026 TaxID=2893890 RepID=UPI0022A74AE0|nr:HutD family protein [Pseudomonas sp. KNUC1026]